MHLGSIYLIVNDFNKSIKFYEKLLQISLTIKNMDRFAMFEFDIVIDVTAYSGEDVKNLLAALGSYSKKLVFVFQKASRLSERVWEWGI